MRLITIALAVLLVLIQYPLWLGKGGWLRVWELHRQLEAVQEKNDAQKLKNAKLVKSRRDGKVIYYSLDDDHVAQILRIGTEHLEEQNEKGEE